MKLSSYCSHDLKMIIFYRGHARPICTRVIALWQFFNSKSCLCNSSCSFQWILVIPSSSCCHDLKSIILYRGHAWLLFTSYGPLSVLAIYRQKFLSAQLLQHFFPVIVSMTWRWSYFIEVMLNWFLPELRSFGIVLTVSLVSAAPLAVFRGF